MKVVFFRLPGAGFPAAALLSFVIAAGVTDVAGQSNSPAPPTGSATAQTDGPLARIAMVGASVTSGYASIRLAGNSSQELCRLNHYLDVAITAPHEPVRTFSSPEFFLNAENSGRKQIDAALQIKPTLVVGVDFLFWYCYGDHLTEPQRLERFDRGLKMLEAVPCPLIVGDIPDASAATNGLLSPGEVPTPETMAEANRRLDSWAASRPQVSVVKLSTLMRSIGTGQEIVLHGNAIPQDQARHGFQPDHLHLLPAGCAVLTEAMFDSLPAADVAGKVLWNSQEIEQGARAAIASAWPEMTTTGTVFDPSNAPASGQLVEALLTAPFGSPDVQSDAGGKYSMIWSPAPSRQNSHPKTVLLARDALHNWAAFTELSPTNTNVDLHLQPGLTLSGNTQDTNGRALSRATIQIMLDQDGLALPFSRVTNGVKDQGAFVFRALLPGRSYRVLVSSPDYAQVTVMLPAEKTQTNQIELPPIALRMAKQQVAGQVLRPDGQPAAGAFVSVTYGNEPARNAGRADAQGHFLIKGLYDGPLNVRVSFGDSKAASTPPLTADLPAQAGDTNLLIKLGSSR